MVRLLDLGCLNETPEVQSPLGQDVSGAGRQEVFGQNFVGQDVTRAISLIGQEVLGQDVTGAGCRGAELLGEGRHLGNILGAERRGAGLQEVSGAGCRGAELRGVGRH